MCLELYKITIFLLVPSSGRKCVCNYSMSSASVCRVYSTNKSWLIMYSLVFAHNHNSDMYAWSILLFVIGFFLIHILFHVLLLMT